MRLMDVSDYLHECGGSDCPVCCGELRIPAAPHVIDWSPVKDTAASWKRPDGTIYTFEDPEQQFLIVLCPLCHPSYYPHLITIH